MPKGQDSPGTMSGLRTSTPTQGSPLRTSLRTSKPTQDSPLRTSLRGTIGDDEEDQIEPVVRRLPSLRLLSPGSSKNKHASPPVEPPSELWLDGMVSDSSTVDDDDDLGGLTFEMEDGRGGGSSSARRRGRGSPKGKAEAARQRTKARQEEARRLARGGGEERHAAAQQGRDLRERRYAAPSEKGWLLLKAPVGAVLRGEEAVQGRGWDGARWGCKSNPLAAFPIRAHSSGPELCRISIY
jgi:hypothetical protein